MDTPAARLPDTYAIDEAPVSPQLASVGVRFFAQTIDTTGALFAAVGLVAAVEAVVPAAKEVVADIMVAAWFGYVLLKDGWNGQSIGKRLTRIRVVHGDTGAPCTLGQSFVRNFTTVLGIFDALFVLGSKSRRLGDIIANTRVVYAR